MGALDRRCNSEYRQIPTNSNELEGNKKLKTGSKRKKNTEIPKWRAEKPNRRPEHGMFATAIFARERHTRYNYNKKNNNNDNKNDIESYHTARAWPPRVCAVARTMPHGPTT
jgi:hypothetical protein